MPDEEMISRSISEGFADAAIMNILTDYTKPVRTFYIIRRKPEDFSKTSFFFSNDMQ